MDEPELDLASRRYRELIEWIGRDLGGRHGWKSSAARLLQVSPSYVSKILSSAHFQVGADAIDRAVKGAGVAPEWFTDPEATAPRFLRADQGPVEDVPTSGTPQPSHALTLVDRATSLMGALAYKDEELSRALAEALAEEIRALPLVKAAEDFLKLKDDPGAFFLDPKVESGLVGDGAVISPGALSPLAQSAMWMAIVANQYGASLSPSPLQEALRRDIREKFGELRNSAYAAQQAMISAAASSEDEELRARLEAAQAKLVHDLVNVDTLMAALARHSVKDNP